MILINFGRKPLIRARSNFVSLKGTCISGVNTSQIKYVIKDENFFSCHKDNREGIRKTKGDRL